MSDDGKKTPVEEIAAVAEKAKRAYVKPALVSEKIFESAAACGKADPSQFICKSVMRGGS